MNENNVLISGKDDPLLAQVDKLKEITKKAKSYTFSKFKYNKIINIYFRTCSHGFTEISEKVSGCTYASRLIEMRLKKDFLDEDLLVVLIYQLFHAARWEVNSEETYSLFDILILKGLALHFTYGYYRKYINTILPIEMIANQSNSMNEKNLTFLSNIIMTNNYSYDEIFLKRGKMLPKLVGHSLAYYLVNLYLLATNKEVEDIYFEKYHNIRSVIESTEIWRNQISRFNS